MSTPPEQSDDKPKILNLSKKDKPLFFQGARYYGVLSVPGLVGLLWLLFWDLSQSYIQITEPIKNKMDKYMVAGTFLIWSITGLIIIWRREVPVIMHIRLRGLGAILIGLGITMFFLKLAFNVIW